MSDEERAATRDLAKAAASHLVPANVRDELRVYLRERAAHVLDGPDEMDQEVVSAVRALLANRGTVAAVVSVLMDARYKWEREGR